MAERASVRSPDTALEFSLPSFYNLDLVWAGGVSWSWSWSWAPVLVVVEEEDIGVGVERVRVCLFPLTVDSASV